MPGKRLKERINKPAIVKEDLMARVAVLRRRCYSQEEIARELGVSQEMVTNYERQINERYKTAILYNAHEMVNEMIERYMEVATEAWKAWEESKRDLLRITEEENLRIPPHRAGEGGRNGDSENKSERSARGMKRKTVKSPSPKMLTTRITTCREGRMPRSDYLRVVIECLQAIRDMRGLDSPKEVNLNHAVLDWASLSRGMPSEVPDEIEEKIQQVLQRNQQELQPKSGKPRLLGTSLLGSTLDSHDGSAPDGTPEPSADPTSQEVRMGDLLHEPLPDIQKLPDLQE